MLRVGLVVSVCLYFFLSIESHVLALQHCRKTSIPDGILRENVVNLVYTMDTSCGICVQQASRLPQLKRYLEKKGIKTHVIIGTNHDASERISGLVRHVQVNNRQIWRSLGAQSNHFYVIDRCGRLVFEIINPFSNLNLPFVRSAVVATQFTHRCGLCPIDYSTEAKKEEVPEYPELSPSQEYIPEDIMPLKMILRKTHTHKGDSKIYKYIVSIGELPNYHSHLANDGESPNIDSHHDYLQTTTGRNREGKEEKTTMTTFLIPELPTIRGLQHSRTQENIESTTERTSVKYTPAQDRSESRHLESTTRRISKESVEIFTETNKLVDEQGVPFEKLGNQHITTKEKSPNSISEDRTGDKQTTELTSPTTVASVRLSTPKQSITGENPDKEYRNKEIQEKSEQVPPDKTINNRRLTTDELGEKQALFNHYKHILDWISFSNDYEAID